jgi:hypothetical protein
MQTPQWFKPGFWGAVVGAAALAAFGFGQLGWKTASSSQRAAQEQTEAAVVTALVPFCVAKAQQDTDLAKLVKLRKEESSYTRRGMVSDAGWATVLGSTIPSPGLADACSDKLMAGKAS